MIIMHITKCTYDTPIATSLNLLSAHNSRSVIKKVERTARTLLARLYELASYVRSTNSALYVEYTIAHDLDVRASVRKVPVRAPPCTCSVVYGATHVPFMLRELQHIGEESCIS